MSAFLLLLATSGLGLAIGFVVGLMIGFVVGLAVGDRDKGAWGGPPVREPQFRRRRNDETPSETYFMRDHK